MKQLEVKDLTFAYDQDAKALKGLSFDVEKGDYVTVIGHNGSGKSTLAKLLIGLLTPNTGTIKIDNEELTEKNVYDMREKVAIVFQNPDNQFIGSTVRDDIAFGLENSLVESSAMDDIINRFSEAVGKIFIISF